MAMAGRAESLACRQKLSFRIKTHRAVGDSRLGRPLSDICTGLLRQQHGLARLHAFRASFLWFLDYLELGDEI